MSRTERSKYCVIVKVQWLSRSITTHASLFNMSTQEIQIIKSKITIEINAKWVKGNQDSIVNQEGRMNHEVDSVTKQFVKNCIHQPNVQAKLSAGVNNWRILFRSIFIVKNVTSNICYGVNEAVHCVLDVSRNLRFSFIFLLLISYCWVRTLEGTHISCRMATRWSYLHIYCSPISYIASTGGYLSRQNRCPPGSYWSHLQKIG